MKAAVKSCIFYYPVYYKSKGHTSARKIWRISSGKMKTSGPQKPNTLAIAGFLTPFVAAGITGLLILGLGEDIKSFKISVLYLTIVPLIFLAGLFFSLKSIPLIEKLGDKDYAYSGLVLNVLFFIVYITSLIYFFSSPD